MPVSFQSQSFLPAREEEEGRLHAQGTYAHV